MVIMKNHVLDLTPGISQVSKVLIHNKIRFENTIDSFGNSILFRVTILSHTNLDLLGTQ